MDGALRRCIEILEAAIGDPRRGLPDEIFEFVSRITPLVNVDLLIKDDRSRTLLTWRQDELFGSGWHVPGGIIRYKESAVGRIRACAAEELGADISCEEAPLLVTEATAPGETRGHHISLLFRCRLLGPPDRSKHAETSDPAAGQWRWHERCPANLLDVQRMYARFL